MWPIKAGYWSDSLIGKQAPNKELAPSNQCA